MFHSDCDTVPADQLSLLHGLQLLPAVTFCPKLYSGGEKKDLIIKKGSG
jgi:hypothetical protein